MSESPRFCSTVFRLLVALAAAVAAPGPAGAEIPVARAVLYEVAEALTFKGPRSATSPEDLRRRLAGATLLGRQVTPLTPGTPFDGAQFIVAEAASRVDLQSLTGPLRGGFDLLADVDPTRESLDTLVILRSADIAGELDLTTAGQGYATMSGRYQFRGQRDGTFRGMFYLPFLTPVGYVYLNVGPLAPLCAEALLLPADLDGDGAVGAGEGIPACRLRAEEYALGIPLTKGSSCSSRSRRGAMGRRDPGETSAVRRSTVAPAGSPWPPASGLVDPRNDPRGWPPAAGGAPPDGGAAQQLLSAGESSPGFVVARGTMIHLRTFTPEDLRYLSVWADDPEIERLVGSDFLRMYREVYDRSPVFYDAVLTDPTQIVLMVGINRDPHPPAGLVRLFNIHVSDGYASIETIAADPRASRRGYGVMASRLVAFYGVDVLGLRRIECRAYAYNRLSINTLRRNGFTQEGVLRRAAFKEGRYWDIVLFGILREEIEEQRRKDRYLLPAPARAASRP